MGPNDQPILPRWLSVAIYATVAVILILLLIVHVTEVWKWRVDGTAFALVGALLIIPIAERLRKVKFGKYVEAEFEEVRAKVEHLGIDFSNLRDFTLSPDENSGEIAVEAEASTDAISAVESQPGVAVARTIEQIVWVDDKPANNLLEIDELERRFDVVTATSTKEGLDKVKSPDTTMVITDAVRIENDKTNYDAGVELLDALRERFPAIPAYVYCGQKTVKEYSEPLRSAGARLVTSSFTELARRIRADARSSFEAEVASRLSDRGSFKPQAMGVDFVLRTGARRIGVEAKDFRRTPKAAPFDAAIRQLEEAVQAGQIDEGLLVVPRYVFNGKQRERAPESVQLLSVDQLPKALETPAQP